MEIGSIRLSTIHAPSATQMTPPSFRQFSGLRATPRIPFGVDSEFWYFALLLWGNGIPYTTTPRNLPWGSCQCQRVCMGRIMTIHRRDIICSNGIRTQRPSIRFLRKEKEPSSRLLPQCRVIIVRISLWERGGCWYATTITRVRIVSGVLFEFGWGFGDFDLFTVVFEAWTAEPCHVYRSMLLR